MALWMTGPRRKLARSLSAVHSGEIPLAHLIAAMTIRAAEILGLPQGRLKIGAPGDLIRFDPNEPYVVDPMLLHSRCKNTPFDEARMDGKVKLAMVAGEVIYEGEEKSPATPRKFRQPWKFCAFRRATLRMRRTRRERGGRIPREAAMRRKFTILAVSLSLVGVVSRATAQHTDQELMDKLKGACAPWPPGSAMLMPLGRRAESKTPMAACGAGYRVTSTSIACPMRKSRTSS